MKGQDLIGQTFSRLTVIGFLRVTGTSRVWLCECVCGDRRAVTTGQLNAGLVKACNWCSKLNRPSSDYRGVARRGEKWRARIWVKNELKILGDFEDEKGAAMAFDDAVKLYLPEFTKMLNFP